MSTIVGHHDFLANYDFDHEPFQPYHETTDGTKTTTNFDFYYKINIKTHLKRFIQVDNREPTFLCENSSLVRTVRFPRGRNLVVSPSDEETLTSEFLGSFSSPSSTAAENLELLASDFIKFVRRVDEAAFAGGGCRDMAEVTINIRLVRLTLIRSAMLQAQMESQRLQFTPASESAIKTLIQWVRPTTTTVGDDLPVKKRREGEEGSSTGSCTICLEDTDLDKAAEMPCCGNLFHGDCIVNWLRTSHLCPLCRYAMPSDKPK